jgi:hypothetical protein
MTAHSAARLEQEATGAPTGDAAALTTASTAEADPPAGADLARVALRRAKADAKSNPVKVTRRRSPASRRSASADSRDPNLLGGIIRQLVVDNQWEGEAAGADLKKEWPSLLGETRAVHWKADAFDEATGTLRVLCDSHSWAANLRLLAPQVIAEINEKFKHLQTKTHSGPEQHKRRTSPLRRLDVQLRSGPAAVPHDATAPAPVTPAPVLRTERGAQPTVEYQQERARLAEARAARTAAGEPACAHTWVTLRTPSTARSANGSGRHAEPPASRSSS